MEYTQDDCKAANYFDELDPEVKQKLVKTEAYQRFVFERARLEKMVMKEYALSGKLTNPEIIALNNEVESLGQTVLDEIKNIQFMLHEPSFEDLQAMRSRLK